MQLSTVVILLSVVVTVICIDSNETNSSDESVNQGSEHNGDVSQNDTDSNESTKNVRDISLICRCLTNSDMNPDECKNVDVSYDTITDCWLEGNNLVPLSDLGGPVIEVKEMTVVIIEDVTKVDGKPPCADHPPGADRSSSVSSPNDLGDKVDSGDGDSDVNDYKASS